jgi:uncharacterized coiled-coil protein SlyX
MDIITQLSQTVVVATFLCGAFSYIVLKPLRASIDHQNDLIGHQRELINSQSESFNKAIEGLNATIGDMRNVVRNAEMQRNALSERVAKVEASAASAHHRIDRLDNLEHFDGMGAH